MIYEVAYIILCVVLAYINYRVIIADKKVWHWLNGVVHLACWCTTYWFTKNWLLVAAMPFIGRLFFDTVLNLMRGLPLDYVSSWVKKGDRRSSWLDRIEWKIFHNGLLPKMVYLLIIAALNIILWTRN